MANFRLPNLKIFKSSAGSGKTYTLVREYLAIALQHPPSFRNILAITFTNKAAREMKERILTALKELSHDNNESLAHEISEQTGLDQNTIRKNAQQILGFILHDYANFSVSTIDSFTNRLVRQFSRDLNLPSRFDIEMDTANLTIKMTDQLMDTVGREAYATEVLVKFTEEKLGQESAWNIDRDIAKIAKSIFEETSLEPIQSIHEMGPKKLLSFIELLKSQRDDYLNKMKTYGEIGAQKIKESDFEIDDFSYKASGAAGIFLKLTKPLNPKDYKKAIEGARFQKGINDNAWATNKHPQYESITAWSTTNLLPVAEELEQYHHTNFPIYATAWFALKNIYSLAVLREIEKLLEEWKSSHQILHISDFNKKVSEFIQQESPEYLFWRIGEKYHHLLIDEFQDTSLLQWKNLFPLMEHVKSGGAEGGSVLLVGDSKQAIYRWRGGNVELLEHYAPRFLESEPILLERNYRSKEAIIKFNNLFFEESKNLFPNNELLNSIYTGHAQKTKEGNENKGFVQLQFIPKENEDIKALKEKITQQTVRIISDLLEEGYEPKDIAILVRTKDEGAELARVISLAGHKVISNDSLLLANSPEVNFIISLMRFLTQPQAALHRAEALHYYFNYLHPKSDSENLLNYFDPESKIDLPKEVKGILLAGKSLSAYDLSEKVIRDFNLDKIANAYIRQFLDVILDYSIRNSPEINGFLDHWDEKSSNFSLSIPEGENAIKILTIHKSKGLEFPIVIMPFTDWNLKPKSGSLFWGKSAGQFEDFTDSFLLPISSDLENSLFKGDYIEEVGKTLLDNLNMLYVAFTRPKERLYVLSRLSKKPKEQSLLSPFGDVSLLLKEVMDSGNFSNLAVLEEDNLYTIGNSISPSSTVKTDSIKESQKMHSSDWRQKISMRHIYKKRWEKDEDEILNPYLISLKEILLKSDSKEDIEKNIFLARENGILSKEEEIELRNALNKLNQKYQLLNYYNPKDQSRNEALFTTESGYEISIDRMAIIDNKTHFIFYCFQSRFESIKKQAQTASNNFVKAHSQKPETIIIVLDESV